MSEDLLDVVRRLGQLGSDAASQVALGDAIYRIWSEGYHLMWGYATWGGFVRAELAPLVGSPGGVARLLRVGRQRAAQAEWRQRGERRRGR